MALHRRLSSSSPASPAPAARSALPHPRSCAPRPPSSSPCHGCRSAPTASPSRPEARVLGEARPRCHHRPRLRLDQGLRPGRPGSVRFRPARHGGDGRLRRPGSRLGVDCRRSGRARLIGIFSLKELNISQPKQLEGQSIGFDVGGGEYALWPAFVKATGIDASKVQIVSMDAGEPDAGGRRQADQGGGQFLRQHRADLSGQPHRYQRHVLRGLRRENAAASSPPTNARRSRKSRKSARASSTACWTD